MEVRPSTEVVSLQPETGKSSIQFPSEIVQDDHSCSQREEHALNHKTQLSSSVSANGVSTNLTTEKIGDSSSAADKLQKSQTPIKVTLSNNKVKYSLGKQHICGFCKEHLTSQKLQKNIPVQNQLK